MSAYGAELRMLEWRRRLWLLCLMASWLGGAATVNARQSTQLGGQVELARLVDVASQRLKLNIEYDAGALKGQVTLRLEGELTDEQLWQLVNRTLVAHGFTTIRHPGVSTYSVVRLADAVATASVPLNLSADKTPAMDEDGPPPGFQVVTVRPVHRSARELVDLLNNRAATPKGPTSGSVTTGAVFALGDANVVVIADLTPKLKQLTSLLTELDLPGAATTLTELPVQNIAPQQLITTAMQLAAKHEALSGQRMPGELLASPDGKTLFLVSSRDAVESWRALVELLDRAEMPSTVTYVPTHFPAKDVAGLIERTIGPSSYGAGGIDGQRFRVILDDLTGSLIVSGSASQHDAVRTLIERLDGAPMSARRPIRTFVIKNRPVDEILATLNELLRSGVLERGGEVGAGLDREVFGDPGGMARESLPSALPVGSQMPAGGAGPPESSVETRASAPIVTSPRSPAPHRRSTGDNPPVTFTVDKGTSTLIATGEPRILDQIATLLKTLDVRQPQVMLEVLLVTLSDGQTMDLGIELEKLEISGGTLLRLSSLFGLGTRTSGGDRNGPDSASGLTGVVLNPGDFSVVLRALETINQGRSMSMPKLLVGNNEQATLDSVVQQPFASVNASNTVSTTSFGGTQDAGTVVTIQPQIAEGDHLLLQYSVSLSAFLGPASSPTLPPPRQQNRVQSVATIPDGFTVVVGGIELTNKSQAISQIPLLGSIPIIGEAFKNRNNLDNRSRFYVFIRANILRGSGTGGFEDLKYLSELDVAKAKVDDGWPELKPRVIR